MGYGGCSATNVLQLLTSRILKLAFIESHGSILPFDSVITHLHLITLQQLLPFIKA